MSSESIWIVVGFMGQAFFSMRFLIQWLMSERARKSVLPTAFWYFSLLGGATLFSYAVHKRDPVFIAGQGLGLFVYLRNLYFVYKESRPAETVPDPQEHAGDGDSDMLPEPAPAAASADTSEED